MIFVATACTRPPPPRPPSLAWQARLTPDERATLEVANAAVEFCEKRLLENHEQVERWCGRFAAQRTWVRCTRDHLECADVEERCARSKAQSTTAGCQQVIDGARELTQRLERQVMREAAR